VSERPRDAQALIDENADGTWHATLLFGSNVYKSGNQPTFEKAAGLIRKWLSELDAGERP
jgi:hypothetical protein